MISFYQRREGGLTVILDVRNYIGKVNKESINENYFKTLKHYLTQEDKNHQ